MEDNGALSNPQVTDELLELYYCSDENEGSLRKLVTLYHKLLSRSTSDPKKAAEVKKRPGEVSKEIYQLLSESDRAMRCKEIQLAVESQLGRPIGWSNVKQCLSANSKGKKSKYVRVGHGGYLVRP